MAKICTAEDCVNPVWGKGFCKYHQWMRTDKKKSGSKKKNYIRPMSEKMVADYVIYRPIRDKYMSEHKTCEVVGCNKPSKDLHHRKGRTGYENEDCRNKGLKLLWDVRWFMAICRPHHTKCDTDPNWARENEYLL